MPCQGRGRDNYRLNCQPVNRSPPLWSNIVSPRCVQPLVRERPAPTTPSKDIRGFSENIVTTSDHALTHLPLNLSLHEVLG